MPLPRKGLEVLHNMTAEYGPEKGKRVFYASINAHKPGSEKWDPRMAKRKKGLAGLME